MTTTNRNDIVVTGAGAVSRFGVGIDELWAAANQPAKAGSREEYRLTGFKAVKHISDRRMMKAISQTDAIGLAAFETAVKDSAVGQEDYQHDRMGVYVGAPAASAFDNEEYLGAQKAADGDVKKFGSTCMSSRPTTLLLGLPNNVLCYGSLVIDARGPNDNYTSGELSGHISMLNAARQLTRGRLDFAVAGGFSAHTDKVNNWLFYRLGHARKPGDESVLLTESGEGAIPADGGVFLTLERREMAESRGAKPLAIYCGGCHRADGQGPDIVAEDSTGLERAINGALQQAGVELKDVGLVFAGQTGYGPTDEVEAATINRLWGENKPAVATLTQHLGNTYEAGGLAEVAIASRMEREVPVPMLVPNDGDFAGRASEWSDDKPYFLVLRTSPWGEYSCMVLRRAG